jgi:Cellulose binding domain
MGLRRVVVTPTFAAGLGVVIAAVIAYPLTKTVISYGPEPPAAGHRCPVTACATTAPGSSGLASAKPVQRLPFPRPQPPHHQVMPARPATAGLRPVMTYQTLRQWAGGFAGQVIITTPAGQLPASWRLRLSYRSAAIGNVWGGTWTARSAHVVIVSGTGDSGSPGTGYGGGAEEIRIYLAVTGPPGPPTGCALNGQPCAPG